MKNLSDWNKGYAVKGIFESHPNELAMAFYRKDLELAIKLIEEGYKLENYCVLRWLICLKVFPAKTIKDLFFTILPESMSLPARTYAELVSGGETDDMRFCMHMAEYLHRHPFGLTGSPDENWKPAAGFLQNFVPENKLEMAIMDGDNNIVIYLLIDDEKLNRPDVLATREFSRLPMTTKYLILRQALDVDQLWADAYVMLTCQYPKLKVSELLAEVISAPNGTFTAQEEELLNAIEEYDDEKICRLINEKGYCFRYRLPMSIFSAFAKLKKRTIFTIFYAGFRYSLHPLALRTMLNESKKPEVLKEIDYNTRLKYVNFYIEVLQKKITPEDDDIINGPWYPENAQDNEQENCCGEPETPQVGISIPPIHDYDYAEVFHVRDGDGKIESFCKVRLRKDGEVEVFDTCTVVENAVMDWQNRNIFNEPILSDGQEFIDFLLESYRGRNYFTMPQKGAGRQPRLILFRQLT